jgi:hypothetical protein
MLTLVHTWIHPKEKQNFSLDRLLPFRSFFHTFTTLSSSEISKTECKIIAEFGAQQINRNKLVANSAYQVSKLLRQNENSLQVVLPMGLTFPADIPRATRPGQHRGPGPEFDASCPQIGLTHFAALYVESRSVRNGNPIKTRKISFTVSSMQ